MAEYGIDAGKVLGESAAGWQQFRELSAQPEILKEAYAGVDPKEVAADPAKQQSIYAQASAMAGQRGMNSLAYNFQKQANELSTAAQTKQLNELKIKDAEVSFANQLMTGAQSNEDLEAAINSTVKDDAIKMRLLGQVRNPDMNFDAKKKSLMDMTMNAKERLDSQRLVLEGQRIDETKRHDQMRESQANAELAQKQQQHTETISETQRARYGSEIKTLGLLGIYPEDPSFPQYLRDYLKTGKTEYERKNEAKGSAATSQQAQPTTDKGSFLENRAYNVEVRGSADPYNAVNPKSGAVGKYQFVKSTWDLVRKEDPSLPTFNKLKGDKDAQEKGANILESQISKEIQNAGLPVTNANKDLWWRFGDATARRMLASKEDAKVSDVLSKDVLDKNPDLKGKTVGQAISGNLSSPTKPEDTQFKPMSMDEMYAKKRGGGLTPKDWDSINPTAVNIGKEYKVNPMALTNATNDEKKQATISYQVTKLAETTADYVKEHPRAVGTLAAILKSVEGMEGDLLDNISKDKRYTGEVQEMGKRLMALGLKDAGSAGRLNLYLEKKFSDFYRQSQTPETLLRIIKARQNESFENLESIYSADKNNLDKSKYKLAFANSAEEYLGKTPSAQAGPLNPVTSRTTAGAGGARSSGMQASNDADSRAPISSFRK